MRHTNIKSTLLFSGFALASLLMAAAPGSAHAASKVLINFSDASIKLSSTIKGYEKYGECSTFSFSDAIDISPGGGGVGSSKPLVSNVAVTRLLDAASPALWLAALQNKQMQTVKIVTLDAMGRKTLEVELSDVQLASYAVSGSSSTDKPFESLSLAFSKMKLTVTSYDAAGKALPATTAEYNLAL
jgi:type VI protein secretion system component Hcp